MKHLFFILLLAPTIAMVTPLENGMSTISKAISTGDVETLASFFDESIEVAVLEKEDIYNKTKAKTVVKDFFSKHQPKSFNQMHEGRSKGKDSQYVIGNLKASNGTFRVYLYMKVEAGKVLIQELRFDKE